MKITHSKQIETELEIKDVSLLTVREAKKLPEEIRQYREPWWLRTAGNSSDEVAFVHYDGFVNSIGDIVSCDYYAIRPAITIKNLESLNFEIGDTLMIQGKKYLYIGNNKALYNDELVCGKFDDKSSDYKKSKIKLALSKWLTYIRAEC